MDKSGCWGNSTKNGWQGILQEIKAIHGAAVMCDHNWILLTSKEYERMVFDKEDRPWDVRGCLQCKELQYRHSKAKVWWALLSSDLEDREYDAPPLRAYYSRLKLFHDTIVP